MSVSVNMGIGGKKRVVYLVDFPMGRAGIEPPIA